jgi:hypothetical protein
MAILDPTGMDRDVAGVWPFVCSASGSASEYSALRMARTACWIMYVLPAVNETSMAKTYLMGSGVRGSRAEVEAWAACSAGEGWTQ